MRVWFPDCLCPLSAQTSEKKEVKTTQQSNTASTEQLRWGERKTRNFPLRTDTRIADSAEGTCLIAHCSQLPISKAQCSLSVKGTLTRCYVQMHNFFQLSYHLFCLCIRISLRNSEIKKKKKLYFQLQSYLEQYLLKVNFRKKKLKTT